MSEEASFAWNGKDQTPCPADYPEKAQKAMDKIDSTMDDLGHLEWTPGLFVAARIGAKALRKQKKDLIDQISESQVYKYTNLDEWGDAGQVTTGILYYGDCTPENAIARILIDNFDGRATDALLNTAVTQVGVDIERSKTFGHIGAVILDSGFQTIEPYARCRKPTPKVKLIK